MTVEFEAWPKIARYNRGILVTEKIDGTNAAVVIVPLVDIHEDTEPEDRTEFGLSAQDSLNLIAIHDGHAVFAQSRTRFIIPGRDNYGFAAWVEKNAEALVATLGPGRHFGEWWGGGIQRRYGLKDKYFSLFNADRWDQAELGAVPNLEVVPVLYRGPMSQDGIDNSLLFLRNLGSAAAPGFKDPEGIVVYHFASRTSYKITLKGDEAPKGELAHAKDEQL